MGGVRNGVRHEERCGKTSKSSNRLKGDWKRNLWIYQIILW